MDIMEYFNNLMQSKEIITLFNANGITFSITNGCFTLIKNNKKTEAMKIALNPDTNSLNFQGSSIIFSLNHDKNNKLYLEKLIIGNIDKDEIKFIMQHKLTESDETIEIHFTDQKDNNHKFILKDESLEIEKASLFFKYSLEKERLQGKQVFSYFKFSKDIDTSEYSKEYYDNCLTEFIELEKSCLSITSYLKTKIPFLENCIEEVIENKRNPINKPKAKTKVYTIKKSKPFYRNDVDEIIARSNRRKLKVIKPTDENDE